MTQNPVLDRIDSLSGVIAGDAPVAEADRRLTKDVYRALDDAGLFAMVVPKAYGGAEMHPVDVLIAIERLGRIDPAAAWNVVMNGTLTAMAAWLPQAGADEMFGNGPVTVAGALNPPCTAVPVDDGWSITGQVPFASGCDHARWFVLPAMEMDGEGPKLDPATGQPSPMIMFVPREQAEIVDTWRTLGMRGTGSADIAVRDVFVPHRLASPIGPLTSPNPAFDGPIPRMFPLFTVLCESVVSIAAATSAVEALVGLAHRKTPAYTVLPLRERELAQYQAGRARALVDASRLYVHHAATEGYDETSTGSLLSSGAKIRMQLAACLAADASAEAGRLVHAAAGASGIREELGFERLFRDLHTLTQHASKSQARYASAGRLMFGFEPDWIFLSF